jgi:5-methylcytosine-specific restriction protein A
MGWGFEIGRVYSRRGDIHERFGGQQQGGIVTPAKHSVVILITGEEGLEHGYSDRFRSDGAFEYFGEGQVGDMRMRAGNLAVAEHSANGKSLLLFRKVADGLRFEGEMVCETFHIERAPDREGNERDAIVFELRTLEAVAEVIEAEATPEGESLDDLRKRALSAAAQPTEPATQSYRNVYQRSRDVRDYVLARAKGSWVAANEDLAGTGIPLQVMYREARRSQANGHAATWVCRGRAHASAPRREPDGGVPAGGADERVRGARHDSTGREDDSPTGQRTRSGMAVPWIT